MHRLVLIPFLLVAMAGCGGPATTTVPTAASAATTQPSTSTAASAPSSIAATASSLPVSASLTSATTASASSASAAIVSASSIASTSVVSATSSTSAGAAGVAGAATSGAVYKGTITLTGTPALSASFTSEPDVSSCKAVGKGGTPFSLTAKHVPAQGHTVSILVEFGNLPTPAAGQPILVKTVGANIGVDQDLYITTADPADILTVNADGSGSFKFSNASTTTTPAKTLSGALNWTCVG
jgi:hypothetical protein